MTASEATTINPSRYMPQALTIKEKPADSKGEESSADSVEIGKRSSREGKFALKGADSVKGGADQPVALDKQASSASFLGRAAAGAMVGVTLVTAVAGAAAPVGTPASPPPENTTAPISREMEMPAEQAGPLQNYTYSTSSGAVTQEVEFPTELNFETEGIETLSALTEGVQTMGVRTLENVEFSNVLRLDVFRSTYTQEVDAPPGVTATGVGIESLDAAGNILEADELMESLESPSSTMTETHQRELAPFGVDLGDGLFYDINGNITFNPLRVKEDFSKITVNPRGAWNSTSVKSDGTTMRIDPPGLWNSIEVTKGKGKVTIDQPGIWNNTTAIYQKEGRTVVQPPGFSGWMGTTNIKQDGNRVTYDPPGVYNSTVITKRGNDTHIAIPGWGNNVTLSEQGSSTRIAYPGWANDTIITRSGNKTVINPAGWGNSITITRSGNKITVDPLGWGNSVTITVNK